MMDRNRSGNWLTKALSLLLAVVLWIYVANELNPAREQVLRQIPLEIRGLTPALTVRNIPADVNLRVQGNQNVLADLSAKSVEVWVDLSGAKVGENTAPVQVKLPTGVRLVDVSPDKAVVEIDRVVEKQVRVKVEVTSRLPGGFRHLKPVVRPSQVMLKGPEKVLRDIETVLAQVDLLNRTGNVLETVPALLADQSGKTVDIPGVSVVPGQVEVFVPIVPELPSKNVAIRAPVAGTPAENMVVTEIIPEVKTVTVTGPQSVLDGIGTIMTEQVDVSGAKEDVFKTVRLILPHGVAAVPTEVRVLVKVEPRAATPEAPQPVPQETPLPETPPAQQVPGQQ